MKNYTSLGVMKASEVAPTFTEEKVTEETFEKEKQQGTLYKGFEIPKNAKMLKFRYYSPDGTLMEQNNVPIVYDGTGIKSVQTYYLLTNEKSGITLQSDGWKEEVQTVTAEKRFLWTYIKTTYTNNVYTCTDPCISSVFGEQGERGAVYLGHYADNQTAYSENTPAIFTGDYYLNLTDSYLYIYNKEENVWAKISDFSDYRYNQSMNDIFESLEDSTQVENFMKIKIAWIQRLSASMARLEQLYSNTIKLVQGTDLNGNTTGGTIQSENFVSGSTGWKIDYNGNAEFNNATVRGQIEATSGSFSGDVTGSTISGSTISGGTVSGSEISGGSININDNFIVDSEGNLTANKGTFSGLIKQGCKFYIATRLTITYNGTDWTCKASNSLYTKFFRGAKGIFILELPLVDFQKGIPRVITHYCSDKKKTSSYGPLVDYVIDNTYAPGGSDPAYQINCRSGLNVSAGDPTMFNYLPLYFTDNNNDGFIDPVYAILTLIYI
jgi:hypothetical protein